jgi:surfactin synthase thioesterase subunit
MATIADSLLTSFSNERTDPRFRLFCFPFAGAGASIFREWHLQLPRDVQVLGVQLPGRENRLDEQPFRRISQVVGAVAMSLKSYQDIPFAFFGHSVGALIAFEVARELRKLSQTGPVHLIVSGYRGPSRPQWDAPIHHLSDFLLIQELRRLGGTAPDVLENNEVMQLALPAIRADFEMSETYRYEAQAPLQCPITVCGGLHDRKVKNSDLPAWQSETLASFSIRMFPGDHYFIRACRTSVVAAVAERLGIVTEKKVAGGRL